MINKNNCHHCGQIINQLIETALGVACPACMRVVHGARIVQSLPSVTPQGQSLLSSVVAIAMLIAVAKAADAWL